MQTRSISFYNQISNNIPIESILGVNTSLTCSTWNIDSTLDRVFTKNQPRVEFSTDLIGFNMDQVKADFEEFRNLFITEQIKQGIPQKIAEQQAEELTSEVVDKTKKLRVEKQTKKHEVLEKIEEKLPQGAENQELRARMLTAYLDEHGSELVVELERYTLDEIKAETELFGTVKSSKMSQFLRNYVEAEQTSEEFERNAEAGICRVYVAFAEGFNNLMIPGYSAYASGGDVYEVVNSASSDIALTMVGGKVVKIIWKGSKALVNGAKALGKTFATENVHVVERQTWRQSEKYVGEMLGKKAREQVSYLKGQEVHRGLQDSVRPDFVFKDKVAIEVKNYDIAKNSTGLIREVVRQVKDRAIHLPQGMKQRVMIDVRGQSVSIEVKDAIREKISSKCEGAITCRDIEFF